MFSAVFKDKLLHFSALHILLSTLSPFEQDIERQERTRVVTPPPQLRLHRAQPLHKLQPAASIPSIETVVK